MKLSISKQVGKGTASEAFVEHKGQVLIWNIALLDRTSMSGEFDIFAELNAFWATLPESQQDLIFQAYKKIRNVYDESSQIELDNLTYTMRKLIAQLLNLIDWKKVFNWMIFHSDLRVPADVRDTFNDSPDNKGTKERTYLKEHYRSLTALAITLRAVAPIWGEFIGHAKSEIGNQFKEFQAMLLLADSDIMKSEPMVRLRDFIQHSIPQDNKIGSFVLSNLSSSDLPDWLLGLVVVRKLTVEDLRGVDPTKNLVRLIFRFVQVKITTHEQSTGGVVRDKPFEGSGQIEENNLSRLEGYKIKQSIPAGDIVSIEYYLEDVMRAALRICPDVPEATVRTSMEACAMLANEVIQPPQITLVQWVMKSVISPKSVNLIPKLKTVDTIAIAQALLWHRGHHELSALVSAIAQDNSGELQVIGSDQRQRPTREQLEQLDILFPYRRQTMSKKQVGNEDRKTTRRNNAASESIELTAEKFSKHSWRLTLPVPWLEQLTGSKTNRRYAVPVNIKPKLASLVISIAQRSF